MPADHEGREIYGLRIDPTPDKGRALGRVSERQGREIKKGGSSEGATGTDRPAGQAPRDEQPAV